MRDLIKFMIEECEIDLNNKHILLLNKHYFDQKVYEKWGLEELLKYIDENSTVPIFLAVEDFAKKMDDYSCINHGSSYMFSCARDAALNVLDILLTEEEI